MEKKTIIIGGVVLASGALLYWYWLKKQQPSVLSTAVPAPAAPGGLAVPLPSIGIATTLPAGMASTAIAPPLSVGSNSSAGNSTAAAAVAQWASAGLGPNNLSQFNKMLPSMTGDEISQLNNIITNNLWGTPDATKFWNAWRTKYHILDGTYTNFTDAGRVSELLNYRWAA